MSQLNVSDKFLSNDLLNLYERITNLSYNYGQILNSDCCDLSKDNKLAIGTKKFLVILNLNFNKSLNINFNKQNINEALTLKVLKAPKINKTLKELIKKFNYLNEAKHEKRNQLRYKSIAGSNPHTASADNEENFDISKDFLYTCLFDSCIYEFLGVFNPLNQPNNDNFYKNEDSNDEIESFSKQIIGFKYCKWNKMNETSLLSTITNDNQIIIYNIDHLLLNTNFEEMKLYNLSEIWLNYNQYDKIISTANYSNKYETYLDIIYNLTPTCIEWSPRIENIGELMLVAFKSNKIAIFAINKLDIMIKLTIDTNREGLSIANSNTLNINLRVSQHQRLQITSINFYRINDIYFLLSVGQFNGDLWFKILKLNGDKLDTQGLNILHIDSIPDKSAIKKISILKYNNNVRKYIALIQKEFFLFALLININDSYQINHEGQFSNTQHLAQSKLVNFICLKSYDTYKMNHVSFEYALIYENSYVEVVRLNLNDNLNQLEFQHRNAFYHNHKNYFQQIKQTFLTTNEFLLFQISDFSKINLYKKKQIDFNIDIFSLKKNDKFLRFFDYLLFDGEKLPYNCTTLKYYNDFIWLFRLYAWVNEYYAENIHSKFQDRLNSKPETLNLNEIKIKEFLLKLFRIINFYIFVYYENNKNTHNNESTNKMNLNYNNSTENQLKKLKTEVKPNTIITSSNFYRSNYRDCSLNIIKVPILELIEYSYKIGFENLNEMEKIILLIQGDFAIKKNFLDGANAQLIKWLNENYLMNITKIIDNQSIENENNLLTGLQNFPINYKNYLSCYICSKLLCIEKCFDFNYIECEFGHKIKRCVRSFLPINYKDYRKCCICGVEWNIIDDNKIPNFFKVFNRNEKLCVFCD